MKKIELTNDECSEDMKVQIETIQAYGNLLSKLQVNKKVLEANIHELFLFYNEAFFYGSLDPVLLEWSDKMTLCAGICYYQDGFCTIRLSKSLLKFRKEEEMMETLLHEMIHAYLFLTKRGYSRDGTDGHGKVRNSKDFQDKMKEINQVTGLKLTIYHSFHDEVDSYRNHVWLCNGPCRKLPPYFGMVKRTKNMAPSERDYWFEQHKKTCGGTHQKVAEPVDYQQKKNKKKRENSQQKTLDKFIKSDEKKEEEKIDCNKKRKRNEANVDSEQENNKNKKLKKNEEDKKEELAVEEIDEDFQKLLDEEDLDIRLQEALLKIMNVNLK